MKRIVCIVGIYMAWAMMSVSIVPIEIYVKRVAYKKQYTVGKLYLNGCYFCDTLEDKVRPLDGTCQGKVKGQTAIPAGRYRVQVVYVAHFHRFLPWLRAVPCFTGILIHNGKNADDTKGCILVGYNTRKGELSESKTVLNALMSKLHETSPIYITIVDGKY